MGQSLPCVLNLALAAVPLSQVMAIKLWAQMTKPTSDPDLLTAKNAFLIPFVLFPFLTNTLRNTGNT